jgi:hypothetical protein
MEPFEVMVYVSHYADGSTHRDVLTMDAPEERALAAMMLRERDHGRTVRWSAHQAVVALASDSIVR